MWKRREVRQWGLSGVPGVLHGMRSHILQDEFGQVLEAESISAGLDYPGIGDTRTCGRPAAPVMPPPPTGRFFHPHCNYWRGRRG